MKFYISKADLEKVNRGCDLGDSVGVRVYMHPHVDSLPELVEFSYVEPKPKKKLYGWVTRYNDGDDVAAAYGVLLLAKEEQPQVPRNEIIRAPQFDCEVEL